MWMFRHMADVAGAFWYTLRAWYRFYRRYPLYFVFVVSVYAGTLMLAVIIAESLK